LWESQVRHVKVERIASTDSNLHWQGKFTLPLAKLRIIAEHGKTRCDRKDEEEADGGENVNTSRTR